MSGEGREPGAGDTPGVELDLFGRAPVGRRDWSHRRREPRGLALAWTLYLMISTMVSLLPMVLSGQLGTDVYRPAARLMVVLVCVGVSVLWPVFRGSQPAQRAAPLLDVVRDMGVLLVPLLVLLWPQVVLAGWPVSVVGCLSLALCVWLLVSGVGLLWWHRFGGEGWIGRAVLAGGVMGVAWGAPLVLMLAGGLSVEGAGAEPGAGWMWTPLTAVWEVVRDRPWSGMPAAVSGGHWRVLGVQGALVGVAFVVSAFVCRGRGMAGDGGGGYAPVESL